MPKKKSKKKWYTKKRLEASKKNIKKAQVAWDSMHFSVQEGNIPKTLVSRGETLTFSAHSKNKSAANKYAKRFRKKGFTARTKSLTIGGTSYHGKKIPRHDVHVVYVGRPRKKRKSKSPALYQRKQKEKQRAPALYPRQR